MKFSVDTADIDELREPAETGMLDGVTTNPSLIGKAGLSRRRLPRYAAPSRDRCRRKSPPPISTA